MATTTSHPLDDRLLILNESDAMCDGCGCDPRGDVYTFLHPDGGWFADLIQTPEALVAEVTCPACFAGVEG